MEYYNGSFYDGEKVVSEPSQIELLSGLIEEGETMEKKSNPEIERSRREEEEYWRKRRLEEERILSRIDKGEDDDNDADFASVSGNCKIEEVDKLKGTKAEKLDPNIWTTEDLEFLDDNEGDNREVPDYDVIYQQDVSSTDVYLGMDPEKDPSTMSSDTIAYSIKLPKTEKLADIELNISTRSFSIKSEHYILGVSFPHPVVDSQAKAKWNSKTKCLSLSVPFVK